MDSSSDPVKIKSEENDDHDLDLGNDGNGVTKKEPGAFRTISEVADEIHVPQHVLRFWESRFSQLQPIKRSGGRRYYRVEDIALLKYISELLYVQGYTIKGVQRLLKEDFSRFNKNKTELQQTNVIDSESHSDDSRSSFQNEQEKENCIISDQKSLDSQQEIDELKEENSFLIDSLKGILVELQELRKIIANS